MPITVTRESLNTKSIHNNPSYADKDNVQTLVSSEKPMPTVDIDHLRLHEGRAFYYNKLYPDTSKLSSGASIDVAIAFASGVYAHIHEDVEAGGNAEFYMYSGSVVTGGTSVTAINRDFTSSTTTQSAILLNPTVTTLGTEKYASFIPGGVGGASTGGGGRSFEFLLAPLTTYLFRLTNVDGASHMAHVILTWYE